MSRTPNGAPAAIRAARQEAGLTQWDLAEMLGVPQSRISEWECGKRPASVETCGRIADVLGLTFVYDGKEAAFVELED